jgi:VWFA-related protein
MAFLVVLVALQFPAFAAKRVTIEQLQQVVVGAQASHRSDEAVVQQLTDVKLTARLNSFLLQKLVAASPGPKTTQALQALADTSAFLNPPAEEIPPRPVPDVATQKAIMGLVIHYVARTMPTLPNFMATRVTQHFSDLREIAHEGSESPLGGLYSRGTVRTPVAFRSGQESDDPALLALASAKGANRQDAKDAKVVKAGAFGLSSWGEFGPILSIILVDAAKGKLGWAGWEQWDGKPVAVFQFSVGSSASHYTLQYWRDANGQVIGSNYKWEPWQESPKSIREVAGYSGRLTVDQETGTILKIEIEASLRPDDDLKRADMLVEYGQVKIGDRIYTCPTHSITVFTSKQKLQNTPIAPMQNVEEMQLNDVEFTGYRRFGSEATLITGSSPTSRQDQSGVGAVQGTESSTVADPARTEPAVTEAATVPTAGETPPAPPSITPPGPTANLASSTAPASTNLTPDASDEEVLLHSVNGMPGMEESTDEAHATGSANQTTVKTAASGTFTLQITTRLVDLGLVALDKHGKPVTDLRPDEIEVYDNGRKQQVRGFHHTNPNATPMAAQAAQPTVPAERTDTFTNTAPVVAEVDDVPDTLILMLDESHLAFNDLNRARAEVIRFLAATRPNARIALYAFSEQGFRVIEDVTQDHALVAKQLAKWRPSIRAVSQGQELDKRNNQQFDTVRSPSDLNSVNGNFTETPDYITSIDPQLRQLGQNPLRASLQGMVAIAQHFAPIPGHKSLAWIAGDSVLADWQDRVVGMEKGPNTLDAALRHTQEALTEAHIALYAVDATTIEAAGPDASLANQNVMLDPTDKAYSNPAGAPTRNTTAGRLGSQMQSDLHGIQGPVRKLVESTGGRAINRGSDLKATLDGIEQDSTSLYELSFNPDTPADGKFHTLQLKLPTRKDVKLRYRTGYLYTEETTGTKQRLQQAIWSPQDLTPITLTAEAVNAADSASGKNAIKLRIGFPGLDFQQKDARWTDQLYIFIAERDDATQKATVDGDTLRLFLKQATYDSGMPAGIPYQHEIQAKAKLGSIRVIVVDGNSGKMGSVTLPTSAFHF